MTPSQRALLERIAAGATDFQRPNRLAAAAVFETEAADIVALEALGYLTIGTRLRDFTEGGRWVQLGGLAVTPAGRTALESQVDPSSARGAR
jgi:hypothetical protein